SAARLLASMVQLEQPIEERASPWTVRDESGRREQVPKEFLNSREAKPYHGQATSPGRQRQQLREGILGRYGSEGYEITARRPVGEVKDRWSDRQAMAAQQALDSSPPPWRGEHICHSIRLKPLSQRLCGLFQPAGRTAPRYSRGQNGE